MNKNDTSPILAACRDESDRQLYLMRQIAKDMFGDHPNYLVGVNGSVARGECTSGSDVDLFFLINGKVKIADAKEAQASYRDRLMSEGLKMPSHGGVFENPLKIANLLKTIGGDQDTNEFITRRMLFLLEGEWTFNQRLFENTRTKLIERYVPGELAPQKLCLFLLNDVIRYWRTICVDFEHKTASADKSRAIRLVKLRFSRMLLYLGGLAAVSQTGGLEVDAKRQKLEELFALPTTTRLRSIFGEEMDGPLSRYANFLRCLDDSTIRDQLDQKGDTGLQTQAYQELSEEARAFRDELRSMMHNVLGTEHDVLKAVLL